MVEVGDEFYRKQNQMPVLLYGEPVREHRLRGFLISELGSWRDAEGNFLFRTNFLNQCATDRLIEEFEYIVTHHYPRTVTPGPSPEGNVFAEYDRALQPKAPVPPEEPPRKRPSRSIWYDRSANDCRVNEGETP